MLLMDQSCRIGYDRQEATMRRLEQHRGVTFEDAV